MKSSMGGNPLGALNDDFIGMTTCGIAGVPPATPFRARSMGQHPVAAKDGLGHGPSPEPNWTLLCPRCPGLAVA
jgi:hypothetical protein